jgi:hypothetical protein
VVSHVQYGPLMIIVLAMIVGAIVLVLKNTWPGEDGDDR